MLSRLLRWLRPKSSPNADPAELQQKDLGVSNRTQSPPLDIGQRNSFLAIDFETAGHSRASACALGFALVTDGQVTASGSRLINPNLAKEEWSDFNVRIHGIRPVRVASVPRFPDVWQGFRDLVQELPVVAHGASFDLGVIQQEHERYNMPLGSIRHLCSAELAAAVWPDLRSKSLPIVAASLGLELRHHDPESDALVAATIVLEAMRATSCRTCWELESFMCNRRELDDHEYRLKRASTGEVRSPVELRINDLLDGMRIAVTGTLGSMSRREAEGRIRERGGRVMSNISKRTHLVVVGTSPGSKLQKAEKLGVLLIDEEAFLALLEKGPEVLEVGRASG